MPDAGDDAHGRPPGAGSVLRPMTRGDLDAVMALEPVLFGPGAWSRAVYVGELAQRSRRYVVLEVGGQIVGYAGVDLGEQSEVMTIGVAPRHRRRGHGRRMLDHLVTLAREHGAGSVLLEVRASDAGAQALYAAAGFVPLGVRTNYYYAEGEDAVVMRLDLAAA